MILYHHMDYSKTKDMDYRYRFEMEVLKVAEIMDIWQRSFGPKFDYRLAEKYAGTKFDPKVCQLLAKTVEEHDIFTKIRDNSYKAEYSESLEYILLSDTEKEKYLKMLMYCTGLKEEQMVSETVATIYVCRELGRKLKLSELDKNEVYYAAMLHDIGMLAIPNELLDAPRTLSVEEKNLVKTHVDIMEKTLEQKLSKEIIRIAAGHHERFDGSGYPRGLKASVMVRRKRFCRSQSRWSTRWSPSPTGRRARRRRLLTISTTASSPANMKGL